MIETVVAMAMPLRENESIWTSTGEAKFSVFIQCVSFSYQRRIGTVIFCKLRALVGIFFHREDSLYPLPQPATPFANS